MTKEKPEYTSGIEIIKKEKTEEEVRKKINTRQDSFDDFNNSLGSPTFSNVSEDRPMNLGSEMRRRVMTRENNLQSKSTPDLKAQIHPKKPVRNCLLQSLSSLKTPSTL